MRLPYKLPKEGLTGFAASMTLSPKHAGRAGDETRTRDVLLGKEVLYH
jgi:hypothetical protein